MYKVGDYIVYRKDVCKIIDIKKNHFNQMDYYMLIPMGDDSLKMEVPVNNRFGYLRDLISKKEVEELINTIPEVEVIDCQNKFIENTYKNLMSDASHIDLIKVIKTAYLRNQERLDNNKKIGERDNYYFELAEKYLYNEFSIVLNKTYDETKQYVSDKLDSIENK